jgi:Spy/CpxP family protein refolding chaperone
MHTTIKTRSFVTIAVGLFVIAGLAGDALAKPPGGGPGGPDGELRLIDRYADDLGLDEETRAAIEAIADSSRNRGEKLEQQKEAAREALKSFLDEELPNQEAVMRQVEAIGAIDVEMKKLFFQALIDIRKQLTPEQRQQLLALERKRRNQRDAKRKELVASCELDVVAFCPDAATRRDRMRCMREHRDELSSECSAAIEMLKNQHGPRRGRNRTSP